MDQPSCSKTNAHHDLLCIRNSAEFLRMKTGISTGVSETRSELWKDSQLKISVLMQRLFLLVARLIYSGKNWGHSYQIASPVSIQGQFVYLKTAELFLTLVRLLMNILRLQQLMSPSQPFPWMNVLATPVLSILRRRHPELIFIFIHLVWPEFLKSSRI